MNRPAWPYLQMALNNAWANATLYRALSGLDAPAFAAERPGFFPSLSATLNHVYEVDLFYLDALEQGVYGRSVFGIGAIAEPAALATVQAEADRRLIAFCRKLDEQLLAQTRSTDRPDAPVEERIDALLLHLFQHQIHHRGQAHVQVQHAGIAPPHLDEFHLEFERATSAQAYRM